MPIAIAKTQTKTFARLDLIEIQLFSVLRKTTNFNEESRALIHRLLDEKLVKKFRVMAYDKNNICAMYLDFLIDWDVHNTHNTNGRATVVIDQKWVDNISIDIDEPIRAFNRAVERLGLNKTDWTFYWVNPERDAEFSKKLGLKVGYEPIKYSDNILTMHTARVNELDEVSITIASRKIR